jgi:gamma-glutamyltranspeptidase/glutathione hydrolase
MPIEEAVRYSRIHHEAGLLSIEQGLPLDTLQALKESHARHKVWDDLNLFFGGAHCVMQQGKEFVGSGDPRRGGVARVVE